MTVTMLVLNVGLSVLGLVNGLAMNGWYRGAKGNEAGSTR